MDQVLPSFRDGYDRCGGPFYSCSLPGLWARFGNRKAFLVSRGASLSQLVDASSRFRPLRRELATGAPRVARINNVAMCPAVLVGVRFQVMWSREPPSKPGLIRAVT